VALEAVFRRIDELGVATVYCLGDVIGYGPEPEACIDLVMERCEFTLLGNHDWGLTGELDDFNPLAQDSLHWHRRRLKPGLLATARKRRWHFLTHLPQRMERGDRLFVHASPRDPIKEYVLRSDGFLDPEKLDDLFSRIQRACFVGHTHWPGLHGEDFRFHQALPERLDFKLPAGKSIVNVGSVGQPRDGDPRACFLVVDGDDLHYQRVAYDIGLTQRGILSQGLSPYLAERLERGR
jgi:diadenosine tetraphosphatase ApaH/serine/threonine PP2A family protein phosphatase